MPVEIPMGAQKEKVAPGGVGGHGEVAECGAANGAGLTRIMSARVHERLTMPVHQKPLGAAVVERFAQQLSYVVLQCVTSAVAVVLAEG